MAARAHDVAALSIKGSSAILNFPELANLLPRPASCSPRDVQAAAAKAAAMEKFELPMSSSSSSSTLSSLVSAIDLATTSSDDLSGIFELPSLGTSYDSPEWRSNEFMFVDSVDGWLSNGNPSSLQGFDEYTFASDQIQAESENVIPGSFEALLWDYKF